MIKTILRLLATSTSFVALLFVTNSAIAAMPIEQPITQIETSVVSLSVISPTLQLIGNGNNDLPNHLGCTCAVCVSGVEPTSDI